MMVKSGNFLKLASAIALLLAAANVTTSESLAQGNGARFYLQPVNSTTSAVTADIVVENMTNLYGVEFNLKFDPAAVSVADADPEKAGVQIETGNFLPAEQGFVVLNQVNSEEGTIRFAMTLLNPAPAVSGSGTLARVTFNLAANTPSTVDVTDAKLVSVDLQTIPVETAPLALGSDSAGGGFPWWIVAVAMIVLGLIGLAGFIVLGSRKNSGDKTPAVSR